MPTVREELAGVILGEIDELVTRLESLRSGVGEAAEHLEKSADAFKAAITDYSEQVKRDIENSVLTSVQRAKSQAAVDLNVILESESRKVFQKYAFHEVEKLLSVAKTNTVSQQTVKLDAGSAFVIVMGLGIAIAAGMILGAIMALKLS